MSQGRVSRKVDVRHYSRPADLVYNSENLFEPLLKHTAKKSAKPVNFKGANSAGAY